MQLSVIFGLVFAAAVSADFVNINPEFGLEALRKTSNVDTRNFLEVVAKGAFDIAIGLLAKSDPIKIPKIETNTDTFKLMAENVQLAGFGKLKLTSLKLGGLNSAILNFTLPSISAGAANYSLDTVVVFLPIRGNGKINLEITGITATVGGKINFRRISLSNVTLDFTLENIKFQLSGLFNNEPLSELISAAVTECVPVFLKNYGKRLTQFFSKSIEDIINGFLNPKSRSALDLTQFQEEIIRSIMEQITDVIENGKEGSINLKGS